MDKSMMKLLVMAVASYGFTNCALAANISLTIEGSGSIESREANVSCSENCEIVNQLEVNTLVATAQQGWVFDGWQGQKCDAGEKAMFEEGIKVLDTTDGGAKTMSAADLNGDGLNDLASISLRDGEISVLINQGEGDFDEVIVDAGLNYPTALDLADWDMDGDHDLLVIVYAQNSIHFYENDGNGQFTLAEVFSMPGVKSYALSVADINQDQLPDLLLSSFNADISGNLATLVTSISSAKTAWYLNTGDGFTEHTVLSDKAAITVDSYWDDSSQTAVAIAAEIVDSETTLYRSGTDGVTRNVLKSGGRTYGVAFGDADDDALRDVLVADYEPSVLSLLYNQGSDQFSEPQILREAPEGLTATALVDVNADGLSDAVTGEFNNDTFYYFENKSYVNCVVNSDAAITLTAVFRESAGTSQPTPAPAPAPVPVAPTPTSQESGGGATGVLTLLILMLVSFIYRPSRRLIS